MIDKKKLIDQHYYVRQPSHRVHLPWRHRPTLNAAHAHSQPAPTALARTLSLTLLLSLSCSFARSLAQAIASKATILKPDALNVPADKFKEKFGKEVRAARIH